MSEHEADGGVHDSLEATARTALTVAMQVGERLARLREDLLAEAARRDAAHARALRARFDGERAAAVAQLEMVGRPEWWQQAETRDVVRLAETAQAWQGVEPKAAAALDTIGQQVRDRYGLDLLELAATERAKAAQHRTEAVVLIAEADRIDRTVDSARRDPAEQAVDGAAADDARTASRDTATAPADRAAVAYDSAERREGLAAELERAGVTGEDLAVRLRADTNQARPAFEAASATPSRRAATRGASGPGRARERGDRSR